MYKTIHQISHGKEKMKQNSWFFKSSKSRESLVMLIFFFERSNDHSNPWHHGIGSGALKTWVIPLRHVKYGTEIYMMFHRVYLFSIFFTKHGNSSSLLCVSQRHHFCFKECCISNPLVYQPFDFCELILTKRSVEIIVKPETIKSHQWTSLRCFLAYYLLKGCLKQMSSGMMDLKSKREIEML